MRAIIATSAIIERLEIDSVLERTVFDKLALRNVPILARQTHGEAEPCLGVVVELSRT